MIRAFWSLLISIVVSGAIQSRADDFFPLSPRPNDFQSLQTKSPFSRTLNLNSNLLITGVAQINDVTIITIGDSDSGSTIQVSEEPNAKGWKLIDITAKEDLETARATIALGNGDTVRVTFDEDKRESMLKAAAKNRKAAKPQTSTVGDRSSRREDGRRSSSDDGSDTRKRFEALSEDQRNRAREMIRESFQKNPRMSSEDRSKMFNSVLEKVEGKN